MEEKTLGHDSDDDAYRCIVQPCVQTESKKEDTKAHITIRVCVFFDGTFNNRTNVDLGIHARAMHSDDKKFTDDSYNNEHTNIDKLQKLWLKDQDADLSFSIYVEGIGTLDKQTDDDKAGAFGIGETGILAKVGIAMDKIIQNIDINIFIGNEIHLYLDAFGFSRGAAAARYFVHSALEEEGDTLKTRLSAIGYSVNIVKVKFVGLYDTVASYQILHGNDTEQLHLDSIRNAERVVQLAAADEHRENFRLTNINSAPNRLQIFLPGSHSDVGGGYRENYNESFTIFYYKLPTNNIDKFSLDSDDRDALDRERKWLTESGWYFDQEITDVYQTFSDFCSLKVERSNIKNSYSNITLKLMADFAGGGGVRFMPPSDKNSIPPELRDAENLIRKYISVMGSNKSQPDDWMKCYEPLIKFLRYNYLHFSSQYFSMFGANDPHFTHSDPKSGERKRIIQNG
jgi:hypothetical protein